MHLHVHMYLPLFQQQENIAYDQEGVIGHRITYDWGIWLLNSKKKYPARLWRTTARGNKGTEKWWKKEWKDDDNGVVLRSSKIWEVEEPKAVFNGGGVDFGLGEIVPRFFGHSY